MRKGVWGREWECVGQSVGERVRQSVWEGVWECARQIGGVAIGILMATKL